MVGALGAVGMNTVCVAPLEYAAGLMLPATSCMLVPALRLSRRVPLPEIPDTVTSTDEPDAAETLAILPAAVPVETSVKSSVEMLPTSSLKLTVKAMLVALAAGLPLTVILLIAGMMLSTVALVVSATVVLPPALVAVTLTLRLMSLIAPATMV